MKRKQSLEEFTDGRIYDYNDMVKADTLNCSGCHLCCTGMGNSVVLDPFDVNRIKIGLNVSLEQLITSEKIKLTVIDGCVLPCIKMASDEEESCSFLNNEGRCSIHPFRPGICRLFPLGRFYENEDFKFILLSDECPKNNKAKIKVSKWIDSPADKKYHDFICKWHKILTDVETEVTKAPESELAKMLNVIVLQYFYLGAYSDNFYDSFMEKEEHFRKAVLGY